MATKKKKTTGEESAQKHVRIHQRDKIKKPVEIREFEWTENQKRFIETALDKNTRIMLIKGPAGSSKSLLSIYASLCLLNQKKISEIIYVRSVVESANQKMGYLPGDSSDKFGPFSQPLVEKLDELLTISDVNNLMNDQRVIGLPVNHCRGRTWHVKGIVLDEVQNFSLKEILTCMTRLGKHSKMFLAADPKQSDLKNGDTLSFSKVYEAFDNDISRERGIITFEFTKEDIMREELIGYIIDVFEEIK